MIQTDLGEMMVSHEQQCLDAEELAWLAGFIARETGLKSIAPDTIIKAYGTCEMPLVTESAKGRLWIDRYYIAYEGKKRRIHYAYLTREHHGEDQPGQEGCRDRDCPGRCTARRSGIRTVCA